MDNKHYSTSPCGFQEQERCKPAAHAVHVPAQVEIGDFLADITTEDSKLYYPTDLGHPPSCLEMAEKWRRSKLRHEHIAPRYLSAKAAGECMHACMCCAMYVSYVHCRILRWLK
jgi:hypothetical protein